MKSEIVLGFVLGLACLCSKAQIQPAPPLLPFQGRLTDANGGAISDGARVVQFKIYDAPVGGQAVWNGEVQKLTVNNALVNTVLGTKSDLSKVDFNRTLYLEITIDANADNQITPADPPLLPRQTILPAVFAKEAADSRKLAGWDWGSLLDSNDPVSGKLSESKIADNSLAGNKVADGSLPAGKIADGSLPGSKIADSSIAGSKLAPAAVGSNQIASAAITTDKLANGTVTGEKIKDGTITQANIGRIALPAPDYDSDWFPVSSGQTYQKSLGFQGLPSLLMAYYRLPTGEILAWGLNQYGDASQGNGVVLDFDELGNLYVHAPSGNGWDIIVHLGYYRNRTNTANTAYSGITSVSFRVKVWK